MLPTPRSPRLFRVSATLATLLLASVSAAAQPSAPTPPPADSQTVPVVLTISGGISLGSYQSGVNWALVNFFRHSYHSREFRDAYGVPAYRLAVATGASAGNVNAVLSTLDWCAAYEPRSRAAEESLLWKVWTGMGIHALFPNNAAARRPPRRGDAQATFGIFRRDSIRTLYSTPIGKRFADTLNTACSVQIGVTLTKVAPDSVALNRQIHPRAQRFASVFTLRTRELGNGLRQLELNPGRVGRNRAFGKVVLPPSSSIGTVEYSAVVDIVEASSAFPLAFEPVDVGFYQPDEVDTAGACPRDENGDCAPSRSDTFMDGGVFDNNPLGLAISLFQQLPGRSQRPEQYIYINPDRVRSRALLPRTPPTDTSRLAGRGLAAIGGLLGGAVPAARQYELHSLARALDERMRERITVTDRGHLLVSSHLGAFAGFLGLPFREFDFYAGMYDGLYYAAHDLVCSRYLGGDTAELRRCTREQLHALLNDGRLALSEPARAVSTRLYREEFPDSTLPPLPVPERRGARLLVAIDSALHAAAADTVCRTGSPVARALCRDGFTTFVQKLGTREVRGLTVNWRGCTGDDGDCFADAEMNDLIRDPERYVARLASRVVDRVDNVERGLGRRGSHRAVTLAGAMYHLGAGEPRRGFEKDPSSVPDTRGTWWRLLSHGLPYYVGFGTGGGIEAGYRPSYYLGEGAAIVFPVLPLHFSPTRDADRDQYYAAYGAGLHFRAFRALDVEGSYQALRPYDSPLGAPVSSAEGAVILVEKLRVGVRYVFSDPAGVYPGARGLRVDGLSLTVGLLDANGLVYWTGRLLAH